MPYCFIISADQGFIDTTINVVKTYRYYKPILTEIKDINYSNSIQFYKFVSETFSVIPYTELRESVVLIDEYFNLGKCQPIEHNVSSDVFWGRMILSFPELEFLFLNTSVKDSRTIIDWLENEVKTQEKTIAFMPLFDYNGIRSQLRKNSKSGLLIRDKKARVIEDELSFAYFHAYIAFRRQHNCKLYTTLNHLEQDKSKSINEVDLQIQDLSLGFVDKREDYHILDLADRYEKFPFLKKNQVVSNLEVSNDRDFVVTIGQKSKKSNDRKEYICISGEYYTIVEKAASKRSIILRRKIDKHDFFYVAPKGHGDEQTPICAICGLPIDVVQHLKKGPEVLYKPTKGMYDIENKLGLQDEVHKSNVDDQNNHNTHSAPGILALIAQSLIDRAQYILDNAKQVVDAIHAATLALEAKELLNGLTPTLALQAYSLQQKAEITAECLFVGSEYNTDVKKRFKDIQTEVTFISKRYSDSQRKKAQLNTQLSIAEDLSGIYGNHKQFEEELGCLNEARKLHFKLKPKIWQPFLSYLAWSMDSLLHFALALVPLQVFFCMAYYTLLKSYEKSFEWDLSYDGILSEVKIIIMSLVASLKYSFTTESSKTFSDIFEKTEPWSSVLLGFQGFCSLTSLSIFTAMIFLRISRK